MIRKLGDIATFRRGLTYSKGDEAPLSDKRVLRSNNIDLESSSLDLSEIKYLREDFIIPEDRKLVANSIFICMSNGSKQHVGKVAFIPEDMDYAFGGFMGLIVPSPEVSAKYVFYACQSSAYRSFLSQVGNGIGITNLRFSDLEKFEFPLPSLTDQQRIVAELELLSGIIEKKRAQLNTLDDLAMSMFAEAFEGNMHNWETLPLEKCINKVKYTTKLQTKDFLEVGKYPIISQEEDYISGYWNSPDDLFKIKKPVVIFGDHTRILKYVDFDFVLGADGVKIIESIDTIHPHYLYFFLKSNPVENLGYSRHFKLLKEKPITIPPMSLQIAFVKKVESIDSQKKIIHASLMDAKSLLASRMDKYFNI